jgi:hypothetical protein
LGVVLALAGASVAAADPAGESGPASTSAPAQAPTVGLDSLLRLPTSTPAVEPRSGGASRQEWQGRFATARADVETAQQAIEKAQQELGQLAGGSAAWQMSAPGASANTETAPVSFRLRQELRRQRDELAAAERRLTELEVEANLAGVPEEWMQRPEGSPASKSAPGQ